MSTNILDQLYALQNENHTKIVVLDIDNKWFNIYDDLSERYFGEVKSVVLVDSGGTMTYIRVCCNLGRDYYVVYTDRVGYYFYEHPLWKTVGLWSTVFH